jgi:hypothetical protein
VSTQPTWTRGVAKFYKEVVNVVDYVIPALSRDLPFFVAAEEKADAGSSPA